ncbi:MAG: hypothetical protein GPJ52_13290 [Candidatus Heimdallarchaeota archaeon]|nr:hypothetical protein [Candidatus Heimdallarchaeota archaeon]
MFKNHLISQKSIKSNFLLIFSLVIILSLNSSFLLQSNTTVSVESDIQPVLEPNDVVFDWLIMIYLDGDNNLEEYAIDDINEMEAGKITGSSIAVIVMVDRISGYDTTNGDWTDTRIYNITSDGSTSTINSVILEYEGEANMGDGAVLESFLDYCFTNFDANNYWLNLWDHGGGTDGICWDDTDSSDFLTIDEMQTAIQNSVTTHSRDIDLITHDACFMNMLEVAYELKDLADYFVASEESIPADGFDYETIISDLEANPTMNASVLSEIIVDSYESFYDSIYTDVALSTINLTLFDTFVPYLNYFALNLTEVLNDGIGRVIDDHFFNSQMFYDDFVLDFVHFIEEILANNTLMMNYPDLNQSAINLITQLNSLIVDNYQGSAYSGNANGVTIFMPYSNSIYDLYIDDYIASLDIFTDMDWQTDTLWDEFLANFYIRGFGKESTDFELLELGVNIGTQSLLSGEEHYYEINLSQTGVFEINTQVFSGDADIFLYYDEGESFRLHAYSQLFNPDDGSLETIRADLRPGRFVIMVWGFEASSYDLIMEEVEPIPISVDETVYGSAGTQEGTMDYHYLQIMNYYYNITLSPGSYEFTLTYNGDNVDFDLFILDQNYTVLYQAGTVYDVDQIDLNVYSDITYIICIYGYSGYGSFSFEVTESTSILPTTPTTTNQFNGFAYIVTILGILALVSMYRIFVKKKA